MPSFTALPPLALYIHVPWCVRKCPYCDFNSHAVKEEPPEQAYVDALLSDLAFELPGVWGRVISSVFIGGGTPSLLSPEAIHQLLDGVRARLRCAPGMEITLEANPGTLETGRFEGFRQAGVNRLSIGVQSFQDSLLTSIGRIHDGKLAIRAVEAAHAAGFDSFNLDLMFGLPGQTAEQAISDINTAVALAPAHISYYELTLEPNTAFHNQPPSLPPEDDVAQMQSVGVETLMAAGFANYEVSAFTQPGRECQHNLNYWRFGDYLGIGAGAHGKISDAASGQVRRYSKQRHPERYLATAGGEDCLVAPRELDERDLVVEFMMNALRLTDGVPRSLFSQRTGLDEGLIQSPVRQAISRGLLEAAPDLLRPSPTGRRYLNDLLELF
ncbi:MAG: radical SAM family heme chaperone HemW [Gammaproteobacteria bacterium]